MRVVIALADFEYKGLTIHKGDMVSGNLFDGPDLGRFWSKGLITWYKIEKDPKPRNQANKPGFSRTGLQKSLLAFL